MLCKVNHCAGHVSVNTRPHQPWWGDRDGNCYLMCRMQSDGWLYSKVGRDTLKAPCLRATVLCAAVFHLKIVCTDRDQVLAVCEQMHITFHCNISLHITFHCNISLYKWRQTMERVGWCLTGRLFPVNDAYGIMSKHWPFFIRVSAVACVHW